MYKCGIIGAGNKGALCDAPGTINEHKHISYAHAIKDHKKLKLTGFYDIRTEASIEACQAWGIEENMPIDGDMDIMIIATNDESHYEYLRVVAELDVKLVICEKPLCMNSEEAFEIMMLFHKNNVPLMVDYTRRYIPRFRNFKTAIENGETGDFIKGYLYFNRGWEHSASHFIDLALWYNGSLDNIEIHEVDADFQWLWQCGLIYEHDTISEHFGNAAKGYKVSKDYDDHLMHVMNNACNFLDGKEELYCNDLNAFFAIKETERMMNK